MDIFDINNVVQQELFLSDLKHVGFPSGHKSPLVCGRFISSANRNAFSKLLRAYRSLQNPSRETRSIQDQVIWKIGAPAGVCSANIQVTHPRRNRDNPAHPNGVWLNKIVNRLMDYYRASEAVVVVTNRSGASS